MSEELARKLKAAREKLGLSQSQAAKAWGIPQATLEKWEQNARTPKGIALRLLTERLDAILAAPPAKAAAKPKPARKRAE